MSCIIAVAAHWTKFVKLTLSITVHWGGLAKNHFWPVATQKKGIGEQLNYFFKNKTDLWWGIHAGLGETRATKDENLKKKNGDWRWFLQHLWYKIAKTSEKREKKYSPAKTGRSEERNIAPGDILISSTNFTYISHACSFRFRLYWTDSLCRAETLEIRLGFYLLNAEIVSRCTMYD